MRERGSWGQMGRTQQEVGSEWKENEKGRKDTAGELERGRCGERGQFGLSTTGWETEREGGGKRTESERTGCSSLPRLPAKNLVMALFSNARGHRGHTHQPGVTFSHKTLTKTQGDQRKTETPDLLRPQSLWQRPHPCGKPTKGGHLRMDLQSLNGSRHGLNWLWGSKLSSQHLGMESLIWSTENSFRTSALPEASRDLYVWMSNIYALVHAFDTEKRETIWTLKQKGRVTRACANKHSMNYAYWCGWAPKEIHL